MSVSVLFFPLFQLLFFYQLTLDVRDVHAGFAWSVARLPLSDLPSHIVKRATNAPPSSPSFFNTSHEHAHRLHRPSPAQFLPAAKLRRLDHIARPPTAQRLASIGIGWSVWAATLSFPWLLRGVIDPPQLLRPCAVKCMKLSAINNCHNIFMN